MTNLGVYIVVIHHRHGTNFYADLTQEGLQRQVHAYSTTWWDEMNEVLDEAISMPHDLLDAIDLYFETHPGETIDWGWADVAIDKEER